MTDYGHARKKKNRRAQQRNRRKNQVEILEQKNTTVNTTQWMGSTA